MELSVRVVWSVVNIIFLSYLLADGHMLFWGNCLLADGIHVVWGLVCWLTEYMLFGELSFG